MDNFNIAVILVTFNRCEMLKKNLSSLKEQGNLTFFIIDNNSSDNTQQVVEQFSSSANSNVYYYNTHSNLGGAGGFSFGCKKALSHKEIFTHLWLTDDDVIFDTGCLRNLEPYMDQRTILQPMRYALDGSNAEASATLIDLESIFILNHKRNSVMNSKWVESKELFDLQNIPFEGPIIPREIFNKIGIPDARYFIFSDDLDFSLKASAAGFKIKCVPSAKMTRLRPAESNYKLNDWKSYFVYRNFFRIEKKFGRNFFVRKRPYLLFLLISVYCIFSLNIKGLFIIKDALKDGMSENFSLRKKYIP